MLSSINVVEYRLLLLGCIFEVADSFRRHKVNRKGIRIVEAKPRIQQVSGISAAMIRRVRVIRMQFRVAKGSADLEADIWWHSSD